MADDLVPTGRAMGIVRRASDVVRLVAAQNGGLSVAEVAERLDLPRASVYRLTEALVAARLVELGPDGRLRASLRCLRLGDAARVGLVEWADARAVLDEVSDRTGLTAFLSVPDGDRALCIDWARGRGISVLALKPGRTLPLHAGAAGRVVLAYRPEPLEAYLAAAPFAAYTPYTLTAADQLRADVAATRERGWSRSDEDVTIGIGAVGVPLRDADGTLRGALTLAGLAPEVREQADALVAELRSSAPRLGRAA